MTAERRETASPDLAAGPENRATVCLQTTDLTPHPAPGSPPAPAESTATTVAYSRFPAASNANASLHTRCPATVVDARTAHEFATGSYAYRRGPFPTPVFTSNPSPTVAKYRPPPHWKSPPSWTLSGTVAFAT